MSCESKKKCDKGGHGHEDGHGQVYRQLEKKTNAKKFSENR